MLLFEEDIESCLATLHAGGTILYPTDTIWGIGCDATNEAAVNKIVDLKGKQPNKGLIVLLASERDILRYVAAPDPEVFNYLEHCQGPTTVIFEHGLEVAPNVLNADGSIAIRVVKEDFCRYLIKRLKRPLVSTSANLHGQASPQSFKDVSTEIITGVNYVVKFRQNDNTPKRASSIVFWKNGGPLSIRE